MLIFVIAARDNQSVTTVMKEAIERTQEDDSERKAAAERLVNRFRGAPDQGTGRAISWKREDLYDRDVH